MCGVSTSLRFPGQLNGSVTPKRLVSPLTLRRYSDLRKLCLNLIPFPRVRLYHIHQDSTSQSHSQLHFLAPSYAPLYDPKTQVFQRLSVPDLTSAYVNYPVRKEKSF